MRISLSTIQGVDSMYFPILRGKQFELLAIRELVAEGLLSKKIFPVIEPVKLTSTLTKAISICIEKDHQIAIIQNPIVGSFQDEYEKPAEGSRTNLLKKELNVYYQNANIIPGILVQENAPEVLEKLEQQGISSGKLLAFIDDYDYLDMFHSLFDERMPQYALIPDETAFKRSIRQNRVLCEDRFERRKRSADYSEDEDKPFSTDHLYYQEEGYQGFSDYSVIGKDYFEKGFAPRAVAIHIVYFASDESLRIRHFVSDSNDGIKNPAMKFYEALSKLETWCASNPQVPRTLGLRTLLEHHEHQTYPGLGSLKKLSIMHHLELMGSFLDREH